MRTVADVVASTTNLAYRDEVPAPPYQDPGLPPRQNGHAVGLSVLSMRKHMTDEGWQLFAGLRAGGYLLAGFSAGTVGLLDVPMTHVPYVLEAVPALDTLVLQDKREWIGRTAGPGFDYRERYTGITAARDRPDLFRGTVLKDAHADHVLHLDEAAELSPHFWIVYYHPDVVKAQAGYVRREHLIRTWHSVDVKAVPPFNDRDHRSNMGVLSGALSRAYPLRSRLALACRNREVKSFGILNHPGYGRNKCYTGEYLWHLSQFPVAICTSSRYGYAVRKIIEATACGCTVVTDLPADDVLPEIDGNLVRVDPDTAPGTVDRLVGDLAAAWDADRQRLWAERALRFYDYRALGIRLANDIELLRRRYSDNG